MRQNRKDGNEEARSYHWARREKQKVVQEKYLGIKEHLTEKSRRLWAATEAKAFGRGGIRAVAEALNMSKDTVMKGLRELAAATEEAATNPVVLERQRREGGGRKSVVVRDQAIVQRIEAIVNPVTRGDPMSPLRWTSKSLNHIQAELNRQGHPASPPTISKILQENLGYTLQSLKKSKEGKSHPDRDAQFQYINGQCQQFQQAQQPVISVDAKKKELIGEFKNGGQEWQPKGQPEQVQGHDFEDKELGKGLPYGIHDIYRNEGWVSVGVDHDTAEFAVSSIRQWWLRMGRQAYPQARQLLITADAGGSNGYRVRLWKRELQKFADEFGLTVMVCHFPPGTSKWNKIEHRMFCHITANWRGRALISLETVVNLIANTQTRTGLRIECALDEGTYPKGIVVNSREMKALNLTPSETFGRWNYQITPRTDAAPK
jgi:hypothetical protein